jgi:outer membrane biosynthesis protein TonB
MVRPRAEFASLRFSRLEKERLIIALLFSLFAHLVVWGVYEGGKKAGWWEKLHWPKHHAQVIPPKPVIQPVDPAIFVDVSDPSPEPPKQAKYYSDRNSRAANPEADIESNQPKLTGKQKFVPKTEDTPKPVKAKPAPPTQPQPPAEAKPAETKPATTLNPGLGESGKPEKTTTPDQKTSPPQRPRTIQQALAEQPNQIAGQQMQQDGGVHRHALKSSLDAMSTPFGAYDKAIIDAIQTRWYALLDSQQFASDRTGMVTISFRLMPDGTITESKINGNTVGDLLGYVCQEAIEQAAPFGKWPPDMRRMIGANFREITFTFYYY